VSLLHRFTGEWGRSFSWDGARTRVYSEGATGASETWLIGKAEGAQNFALRYYELTPGGHSREEAHDYDHGVVFIRGEGLVLCGEETYQVSMGDVVYIDPNERHQIVNRGETTLGWFCTIPARRPKKGKIVWAEEGLAGLETT